MLDSIPRCSSNRLKLDLGISSARAHIESDRKRCGSRAQTPRLIDRRQRVRLDPFQIARIPRGPWIGPAKWIGPDSV